jgi:hypothetical protein
VVFTCALWKVYEIGFCVAKMLSITSGGFLGKIRLLTLL